MSNPDNKCLAIRVGVGAYLKELKDLVLAKIIIGVAEHLIIDVL